MLHLHVHVHVHTYARADVYMTSDVTSAVLGSCRAQPLLKFIRDELATTQEAFRDDETLDKLYRVREPARALSLSWYHCRVITVASSL